MNVVMLYPASWMESHLQALQAAWFYLASLRVEKTGMKEQRKSETTPRSQNTEGSLFLLFPEASKVHKHRLYGRQSCFQLHLHVSEMR